MAEKSRTEYSARNTTVAMIARAVAILMGFAARVVFTHTLSEAYVGINGLFTDLLNVLALSELGVGTAITYALYRPISEKNIEKQKSLMRMYRTFYRMVALFVLIAGLLIVPFLNLLIKDSPDVEHLTFIYLMYLFNSVLSYLLIYKKTLVDAHQMNYISVLYQTVTWSIQNVLQIFVLIFTRNFILYLSVLIMCTVGGNIAISIKSEKMFPYLKDKNVQKLPKEEAKGIYQNIRAMLMHKVGNVIVNNTDNLLLSALVGSLSVGRYSNYFLIIGSVTQVLNQMFQGITASVGNLGVEESRERIGKIFEASFFMGQWMFGMAAICLYEILNPFVEMSFGKNYVFAESITLILCVNFYLTGMRQATLVFRDSMGLFRYDKYKALPEAFINLVTSIILGKYMGTAGIFIGTLISTVTTSLWVEPYMLYKHRLKQSSKIYFVKYGVYAAVTFILWFVIDLLCRKVSGGLFTVCVLRLIICIVVTNLCYLVLYHRTREFRLLMDKGIVLLKNKFGKKSRERERGEISSAELSVEERKLFALIRESLTGEDKQISENGSAKEDKPAAKDGTVTEDKTDWDRLLKLAKAHGVAALIYDRVMEEENVPITVKKDIENITRGIVQRNYRLLFLCKYLVNNLKQAGIDVLIMKGVATASLYPVPEYRKSGDVDLLLTDVKRLDEAVEVLKRCGCRYEEEQHSHHHVVFITPENIEVELHTMLAEPFDNRRMNDYMAERLSYCIENVCVRNCMGLEFEILTPGYHAYELLLHMLQHFLRAGFGLKLLCDWVVFWNSESDECERQEYLKLVCESGIKGFSDMITLICVKYLGLKEENIAWMNPDKSLQCGGFLEEILEAEEFGKNDSNRMVAMRDNSLRGYVREFHHQMHLNFPRAGCIFILWPVLWGFTFVRFARNNKKVRGVKMGDVLRKAGQRSKVIGQMHLWDE